MITMEHSLERPFINTADAVQQWLHPAKGSELYELALGLDQCLEHIPDPEIRRTAIAYAVSIAKAAQVSEFHKAVRSPRKK